MEFKVILLKMINKKFHIAKEVSLRTFHVQILAATKEAMTCRVYWLRLPRLKCRLMKESSLVVVMKAPTKTEWKEALASIALVLK